MASLNVSQDRSDPSQSVSLGEAKLPDIKPEPSLLKRKVAMIFGLLSVLSFGSCQGMKVEKGMRKALGYQEEEDQNSHLGLLYGQNGSTSPNFLNPRYLQSSGTGSGITAHLNRGNLNYPRLPRDGYGAVTGAPLDSGRRGSSNEEDGDLNLLEKAYNSASRRIGDYIDIATSEERLAEWLIRRGVRKMVREAEKTYHNERDFNDPFLMENDQYFRRLNLPGLPDRSHYRFSLPSISDIRKGDLNVSAGAEWPVGNRSAFGIGGSWGEGGALEFQISWLSVF